MIIINAGIPKSGTTLLLRFQLELLDQSGRTGGIEAWRQRNGGFLFCGRPTRKEYETLRAIEREFGYTVVKTHSKPNRFFRKLLASHGAVATYCYRDPRDVMLSAFDHGQRTRAGGDPTGAFREIDSLDAAAHAAKLWSRSFKHWQRQPNTLTARYEDLIVQQPLFLARCAAQMALDIEDDTLRQIADKLWSQRRESWNFNTGAKERWTQEMTPDQQHRYTRQLKNPLRRMGYPVPR